MGWTGANADGGTVRAHTQAMRVEALERVLAVLDSSPDGATVPDLIARIDCAADKETIRLLRHAMTPIGNLNHENTSSSCE